MDFFKPTANEIKAYRKHFKLSQEALATRLCIATKTLANYERGRPVPAHFRIPHYPYGQLDNEPPPDWSSALRPSTPSQNDARRNFVARWSRHGKLILTPRK